MRSRDICHKTVIVLDAPGRDNWRFRDALEERGLNGVASKAKQTEIGST